MYQEDAEAREHQRALIAEQDDRRKGTYTTSEGGKWMPNLITLKASVPVHITVDLADMSVRRVVVDDETIAYVNDSGEPEVLWSKVSAKDENGLQATQHEVGAAIRAAEGGEWPAWEFGW